MSAFAASPDDDFTAAATYIKSATSLTGKSATNDQKLQVYAHYKQANSGDVTGTQPWAAQFEARAKFDAHTKLKGMSTAAAKAGYVAEVLNQIDTLDLANPASDWAFLSDRSVSIAPYFKVENKEKFTELLMKAFDPFKNKDDCEHYAWTFHTALDNALSAHCRETYKSAAAVLQHLSDVDATIKEVLSSGAATLERIEVHGPKSEIEQLKTAVALRGCIMYNAEWGFNATTPPSDANNLVSIHPYFTMKDPAAFKAAWSGAYAATFGSQQEEKTHAYAFCFDDLTNTAFCRESYLDAAGLLVHLGNVQAALAAGAAVSEHLRLEVHGPKEELEKLKEKLEPLGAKFFYTEWGFKN